MLNPYLSSLGVTQWLPKELLEAPVADFVNQQVFTNSTGKATSGARLVMLLSDVNAQHSEKLFRDLALSLELMQAPLTLVLASPSPQGQCSAPIKLTKRDKVVFLPLAEETFPFQDAMVLPEFNTNLEGVAVKSNFDGRFKQALYQAIIQAQTSAA